MKNKKRRRKNEKKLKINNDKKAGKLDENLKLEECEYRDWETDRKSTRLNSSHITRSRMPSSA